jgi:hypothetical protein
VTICDLIERRPTKPYLAAFRFVWRSGLLPKPGGLNRSGQVDTNVQTPYRGRVASSLRLSAGLFDRLLAGHLPKGGPRANCGRCVDSGHPVAWLIRCSSTGVPVRPWGWDAASMDGYVYRLTQGGERPRKCGLMQLEPDKEVDPPLLRRRLQDRTKWAEQQ